MRQRAAKDGSRLTVSRFARPGLRSESAASADNNWWHYCPESKTFYPYVKECPAGWQRVAPTPPDVKERNR